MEVKWEKFNRRDEMWFAFGGSVVDQWQHCNKVALGSVSTGQQGVWFESGFWAVLGHSGALMVICGRSWAFVGVCGHSWTFVGVSGRLGLFGLFGEFGAFWGVLGCSGPSGRSGGIGGIRGLLLLLEA
jgi:hypothetical protein